jgi:hypothetical protein
VHLGNRLKRQDDGRAIDMPPTKIVLQTTASHYVLRLYAPEAQHGSTVIEAVKIDTVTSSDAIKRNGEAYAKRLNIPFEVAGRMR